VVDDLIESPIQMLQYSKREGIMWFNVEFEPGSMTVEVSVRQAFEAHPPALNLYLA
jgi:hypothetical protein